MAFSFPAPSRLLLASLLVLSGCIDTEVLVDDVSYYVDKARCNLRIGVLSDTLLDPPHSDAAFQKALGYFSEREVDAVVIAGDVTQDGSLAARRGVKKLWDKVFPNGKRRDGGAVSLILVTGESDNEKVFEELTGERFAPAFLREVRGYSFVGANWKDATGVDAWALKPLLAKMDKTKPFFYLQNLVPYATCCPDEARPKLYDGGKVTYMLSEFPNAVAICGRTHTPLTDESAFWRGDFTCVNAGSFAYAKTRGYDWNPLATSKASPFASGRGRRRAQSAVNYGLVISVYGSSMFFERLDLGAEPGRRQYQGTYVEKVGPDWKVDLPAKPGPRPETPAPEFWDDTRLMVFPSEKVVSVRFPPILAKHRGVRAYAYEVRCRGAGGGADEVVQVVYSPAFLHGEDHETQPVTHDFRRAELPKGRVRLEVTPLDAFGKAGRAIAEDVTL